MRYALGKWPIYSNCVANRGEREKSSDISSQIDSIILKCMFNKRGSEVADNGLGPKTINSAMNNCNVVHSVHG